MGCCQQGCGDADTTLPPSLVLPGHRSIEYGTPSSPAAGLALPSPTPSPAPSRLPTPSPAPSPTPSPPLTPATLLARAQPFSPSLSGSRSRSSRRSVEDMLISADPRAAYTDFVLIGKGHEGRVYRATCPGGGLVALKEVSPAGRRADAELRLRGARNEIEKLAACEHPNVVTLHGFHHTGRTLWIAMELMDGGKLTELVETFAFAPEEVGFVLHQALKGLEHVHAVGCMHRDMKSDNILLDRGGAVKICDFGFCADVAEGVKRNTFLGSPYWIAPEVVAGEYDARADVWSLGIVGIELCDGEPPLARSKARPWKIPYVIARLPAPRVQTSGWPRMLVAFVQAMLVKRPEHRPSALSMLHHPFLTRGGGGAVADPAAFVRDALRSVRHSLPRASS